MSYINPSNPSRVCWCSFVSKGVWNPELRGSYQWYILFFTFTHGEQAFFIKVLINEKVEIYVTWSIPFSSLKRVHLFLTCKQSIKNYKHSFGETGSEQARHCAPPYWRARQVLTRTLPEMCQTRWTPASPMIREAWYRVGLSWRPNTWLWSGALCSLLLASAGSCLSDSGCPHAHQRRCQDPDLPWRSPCYLQEMPRNNTALQKGGIFRLFIWTFQVQWDSWIVSHCQLVQSLKRKRAALLWS